MAGTQVSQHYVQVVGTPNQALGELRVRRLYADVLISDVGSGVLNESANSTLTLNQTAAFNLIMTRAADSTLNLTQNALGVFDEQEPTSTLNLTHTAIAVRDIPLGVSHSITFLSLGGRTFTSNGTSNLSLSHIVAEFNYVDDRKPAGNVLAFTQEVLLQDSKFIESTLALTQTVNVQYPFRLTVVTPFVLGQHTSTPYHMWVSDDIDFSQRVTIPLPTQHLSHTLNFVQNSPIGGASNTLNFTQAITFAFSYEISQNLGITDQVDLEGLWVRSVEHSNFIGHALTWYEDTKCSRKQYTPFQGENTIPSSTNFTAPSNVLQDPQGDTGNFSIYIPYLGVPTSKVTMRKPEMDNRDRNAYTRVNSETRGGKLIVFSDPNWPHVRTLAVTIVGLTEAQVDELQSFMQDTLGQEIGLTDWEGRLWKGVIVNPNEAATQDGRSRWTVTFEFQGEMLEVEQPESNNGNGQAMNLTQSVTAVIV